MMEGESRNCSWKRGQSLGTGVVGAREQGRPPPPQTEPARCVGGGSSPPQRGYGKDL